MFTEDRISTSSTDLFDGNFADQVGKTHSFSDVLSTPSTPILSKGSWLISERARLDEAPFYGRLRQHFGDIASEPMPDRLANLTEQLQAALDRGELYLRKARPPR